jgi:hypothetical protein
MGNRTCSKIALQAKLKHVLVCPRRMEEGTTMRLADIELYDPDVYVRGVPHDALSFLRVESPVYFHPEPDGRGFWAVTKYDDVI